MRIFGTPKGEPNIFSSWKMGPCCTTKQTPLSHMVHCQQFVKKILKNRFPLSLSPSSSRSCSSSSRPCSSSSCSAMDEASNKNNNGSGNVENNDYLETSKADRKLWLMKCPPVVSRSLQLPPPPSDQSFDSSSHPVAKIILSIDPQHYDDDDSSTEFTMELAGTESGNVPKSYSMDMSTDFIPMSVFSESPEGRISVEGKILNKFDMKPHQDNIEDYAKLCRERTKKSMIKTRQIQVIDDDNGMNIRSLPVVTSSIASSPNDKKKRPVKVTETKRTRRGRGEMEDLMFNLFERQANWTLKQLIQETDQPEKFLREVLKDLCVYNNKGSNQGSYELKPEYKKPVEESILK